MGRWHVSPSQRGRLAIIAVTGAACLFAAACQSSTAAGGKGPQAPGTQAPAAAPGTPQVSITPANGSAHARPSHGVTVTVTGGKLTSVVVSTGHGQVTGTLGSGATSWHTRWPLHTGAHYTVTAKAASPGGKAVTATSSFRTLSPGATFTAQTILGYSQTYGVGIPITINFSSPVTHRAAMERAVAITSSKPVVGTWMWDGNQSMSFRPRTYWPAHTKVSFVAHFNGAEAAPGVYGTANLSQSFKIGNSLIVVASTRTHFMKVYYRGHKIGTWPISTGMPGDDTANGTYLTIEKGNPTRMKGNGYNVLVPYAVRFTWSGNYIHDAWWSVAEQGHINVSHGCVNVSPAHSAYYYKLAVPGDPVTVTGSPVAGKWDDGWTQWFWDWHQALSHSATHMAVQVGPSGSTFVKPSTLPALTSSSVLQGPKAGNYLAK
jgi:lipoprotein-anchoring transpeptidase ErfK/SrfK